MNYFKLAISVIILFCLLATAGAQIVAPDTAKIKPPTTAPATPASGNSASKWYEKINFRGYAQFRYNRLLETNPDLKCEQCDRSIGKGQTFAFRRARMIFSGDVHPRMFIYIQFDYSADASSTNKHFLQIRDAYFDYAFDKDKNFRLRFGQSKVPFGFENMQSSSNRLPLDRSDALNSAVPNERDFGAFLMYTPKSIREKHRKWADATHKGSGDYGMFTVGLYNGQATNKPEQNDNLHAVARITYPFQVGKQVIEPSLQAYSGKYTLASDQISKTVKYKPGLTYLDQRAAASINVYPQPLGILAEYNIGKSPGYVAATDSIQASDLKGGFVTLTYKTAVKGCQLFPFIRGQMYDGPKKHELDARLYKVREVEFGAELLVIKNLELTVSYVISHREYANSGTNYNESGRFLRIQLQANY